jgi:TonB family protein
VEIGVKDYISDIDSSETHVEGRTISSAKFIVSELGNIDFKLDKFPKEFKKNFFQTIDKTFLAFLLLSIFLNIGTILLLKDILPPESDTSAINRLQKNYAKLLLKSGSSSPTYSFETGSSSNKIDSKVISGLSKWMDVYTNSIIETIKNIPPLETAVTKTGAKETSLPSKEELAEARRSAGTRRGASSQEIEREVSTVGLLGLISRDAKATDQEYVDDLMEYASENSEQLSRVLSKLSKIEVPRYGSSGYLKRIRGTTETGDATEARGGRVTTDIETKNVVDNIEQLSKVKTTSIERNVQFEEVPSSYVDKLADASTNSRIRSAQDVLKIVRNHTRALQDCYKQELKYDPAIKGKIVVRFVIDPEGVVSNASIVSSTLNSPRMEQCILTRVKGWRDFPTCDPEIGEKTYRQSFSFGEKNL